AVATGEKDTCRVYTGSGQNTVRNRVAPRLAPRNGIQADEHTGGVFVRGGQPPVAGSKEDLLAPNHGRSPRWEIDGHPPNTSHVLGVQTKQMALLEPAADTAADEDEPV